jgi:hypothetical protein
MAAGWHGDSLRLLDLARGVLGNTSQSSNEKKDCLEAFLRLAGSEGGRAETLIDSLAAYVRDNLPAVVTARGGDLPFGSAPPELHLLATALLTIAGKRQPEGLLHQAAQAAQSERVDTRLIAVRVVVETLTVQTGSCLLASCCLLQALACDPHFEVRRQVIHGLRKVAERDSSYLQQLQMTLGALAADVHPEVRAAVVHVAACWPHELWAQNLIMSAASDPNFRVRRVAELKEQGASFH